MKIGYVSARDLLLGDSITDISTYAHELGQTIFHCFEKKELNHTLELLKLAYKYDFLDAEIPYRDMLSMCDEYDSENVDNVFEMLVRYAERHKDSLLVDYYISHATSALFRFKETWIAKKYLQEALNIKPDNRELLELMIYARTGCTNKEEFFKWVGKIDEFDIVKKLMDFGVTYEEKVANVDFVINACYEAVKNHAIIIDYLNTIEILGTIITFFDAHMTERFDLLFKLACELKESHEFQEATKIYTTLIQYEYKKSACYWNILLCKRKVVDNNALIKSGFNFEKYDEYRYACEEAINEHIDQSIYTSVLKETKHKKNLIFVNLIGLAICAAIIGLAIYCIVFLYGNGYHE